MRYYFAGAYARRAELDKCAGWLLTEVPSARVVSRWLTDPQEGLDAGFSAGGLETPEAASKAWEYGQRDIEDLSGADAIVSFTGEGTRGGRHIEHGWALAWHMTVGGNPDRLGVRMIVVGPREHVFHCHPATEVYRYFDAFLAHEIEQYREENR
jgi:hypothetical protein